jgi:DNA helicase INO80
MSISSIMSGNEPETSTYSSRGAIDSRRSSKASISHISIKQDHLPALVPPHTPPQAHADIAPVATPLQNGDSHHVAAPSSVLPLPRPKPDEKDVEVELAKLEASGIGSLDTAGQELWREEYVQRSLKRARELGFNEAIKRKVCSQLILE